MFEQTLSASMLLLIPKLSSVKEIVSQFYLAGGTALALQCGHRYSEDLDFFSNTVFQVEKLSQQMLSLGGQVISEEEGTLHLIVNEVKISFLHYPYPVLKPGQSFAGLSIASIEDIACMKAVAISQRGEKKDFYDMYEILSKHLTPVQLKQRFLEKYTSRKINCYHILKSFLYFADAERSPTPITLNGTTWEAVKASFILQEKRLTEVLCYQ